MLIDRTFWASLSVDEFFKGYKWQGIAPQLESLQASNSSWQSSLLNSTVEEFFSCSNWPGLSPISVEPSQPAQFHSLTLPVQVYFEHFSWRGNSTLGMVQPLSSKSESSDKQLYISASPEFKLTDLSDLF